MKKLICWILILSSLSLAVTIPSNCLIETVYPNGTVTYTQNHIAFCDSVFNEKSKEELINNEMIAHNKQETIENVWENYLVFSAIITIAGLVAIAVISHGSQSYQTTTNK